MTAPPPGYPAGPPHAYGPPWSAPLAKPGIIPLRPLTLGEIFNGAVGYVRANPRATLGLTVVVVVAMQIISKTAFYGPLAAYGRFSDTSSQRLSSAVIGASLASVGAGVLVTALGGMLLSGMLTVIVGRAVFGAPITIGETWTMIKGRLLPLLGLALLEMVAVASLGGLAAVIVAVLAAIGSAAVAVVVGIPLFLAVVALLVYLWTIVLFAPVLIVLERLPVLDALTRSFRLVRGGFWRVLGIRALTFLVAAVVASAVAAPFSIAGQVLLAGTPTTGMFLLSTVIVSVGASIGEILTAPFNAGVVVLLYADRRMRAEAFDLVLQTGAAGGPAAVASTDNLWLTRPA
nr:hypothetical protein [Mycobacterium sp. E1214]